MSSQVEHHFVHLQSQTDVPDGSQLLTRSVGVKVGDYESYVAIDSAGQKHLLVPAGSALVPTDRSSQGVGLSSRILRVGSLDITFVDLHCRVSTLGLVFDRLADDVVDRIGLDCSNPVSTCVNVLDEWRSLLKKATTVTQDSIVGLIGELEILSRAGKIDISVAFASWTGPSGTTHDFNTRSGAIEVKTTASPDAGIIRISGLDQIDPVPVNELCLTLCRLKLDASAPTIDERIDAVIELGFPRNELLERVADAGYIYESQPSFDTRYSLQSIQSWIVGDNFPGLRRSDFDLADLRGVSAVRYHLAVGSLPPSITKDRYDTLLRSWFSVA